MKKFFIIVLFFSQNLLAQEDLSYLQCLSGIQESLATLKYDEERAFSDTKMILLPNSEDIFFITKQNEVYKSTATKQYFLEHFRGNTPLSSSFSVGIVNLNYTTNYKVSLQVESKTDLANRNSSLLSKVDILENIKQDSFITAIHLEPTFSNENALELAIEEIELEKLPSQLIEISLRLVIDKVLTHFESDYLNYYANPSIDSAPDLSAYLRLLNNCSQIKTSNSFQELIYFLQLKLYEIDAELFSVPPKNFRVNKERELDPNLISENTISTNNKKNYLEREFKCIKDLKVEKLSFWHGELAMAIPYVNLDQAFIVLNKFGSDDFYIFIEGKKPVSFTLDKNWGYEDSGEYRYYFRRFYSQEYNLAFDFTITEQKDASYFFPGFKYMARAFRYYEKDKRVHYEVDTNTVNETMAKEELGRSLSEYLDIRKSNNYKIPKSCESFH